MSAKPKRAGLAGLIKEAKAGQNAEPGTASPRDGGTALPSNHGTAAPSDATRPLEAYDDAERVQSGVRLPRELHELAEAVYWPHRRRVRGGVGAVYTALLERLRTDVELRAWVEAYLQDGNA